MSRPLTLDSLTGLAAQIAPAYDPATATVGVVHLGVGNFFRAHQAVYLDEALAAGETGWGICGVSLRNADTRDALAPQDGLYTVVARDAAATKGRIIGALRELLVAPESPEAVIGRLADPATRWVTLTITEKGYGHRGGRELDPTHPEIAHDLANPGRPRSAVGLLHRAAAQRRDRGLSGLTVLSCDNLSGNGRLLQRLLTDFDRASGGGLAGWIDDHLAFPDTMVDRIVPRTTEEDRRLAIQVTGRDDRWPIVTEPFRQWVIENRFHGPRPELERSGVQIVDDVEPWERMKLRLLNAAHSTIAWLGMPAGLATVDAAVAHPTIHRLVDRLWRDEVIPTLPPDIAAAAPDYCRALMARFANPGLAHRTAQIAMDGSQKLPLRILPSLRARRHARLPAPALTLAVAAWIRYLGGNDEAGESFRPDDPLAEQLMPLAAQADPARAARDILAVSAVFGDSSADAGLVDAVAQSLQSLRQLGSIKTIEKQVLSH